jgi:hypothetical protein
MLFSTICCCWMCYNKSIFALSVMLTDQRSIWTSTWRNVWNALNVWPFECNVVQLGGIESSVLLIVDAGSWYSWTIDICIIYHAFDRCCLSSVKRSQKSGRQRPPLPALNFFTIYRRSSFRSCDTKGSLSQQDEMWFDRVVNVKLEIKLKMNSQR